MERDDRSFLPPIAVRLRSHHQSAGNDASVAGAGVEAPSARSSVSASLQRVAVKVIGLVGIPRSWIDSASFSKSELFRSPPVQQSRQTMVSFVAARLRIDSVLLVALQDKVLLRCPRPHPYRRILDGDSIFERVRTGPGPPLHEMPILARSQEIGLRTEVRHIDHQGVPLPV